MMYEICRPLAPKRLFVAPHFEAESRAYQRIAQMSTKQGPVPCGGHECLLRLSENLQCVAGGVVKKITPFSVYAYTLAGYRNLTMLTVRLALTNVIEAG